MEQWLSVHDAQLLLGGLTTVLIPIAVSRLVTVTWPDWAKFALAALLSLVAAFLTAYTAGQVNPSASLIQNGAVIYVIAQGIYEVFFKRFGWERWINPQKALANKAKDEVEQQVSAISSDMAQKILDPNTPPALDVSTKITNAPTDVT